MSIRKLLAVYVPALMVSPNGSAARRPAIVCRNQLAGTVTQIDILEGDPADLVSLAPENGLGAPNTYAVKHVFEEGRHVTIRCHHGGIAHDVASITPGTRREFSEGCDQLALQST